MLMVIRPAPAADIPVMMALASRTATAAQWSAADYETLFSPGSVPRHCLVLEENCAVHAFIVARQLAREWEIANIAPASSAPPPALATRLLASMLATSSHSASP